MLPERLSTDLTLAQPGRGPPRDRGLARGLDDGAVAGSRSPRGSCEITRGSPTTRWRPGSTGDGRCPPPCGDSRRRRAAPRAGPGGEHPDAGRATSTAPCSSSAGGDGAGLRRRSPRRRPAGPDEPREGDDRGLHDRGEQRDRESSSRSSGLPSLRRVLRSPRRWERIVELAASLGDTLPPEPSAMALQAFLVRRRAADPQRFADISLSVVKLLGSGEYAVEVPGEAADGHFGLAVKDYTHSTAPNRRFPTSPPSDSSRPRLHRGPARSPSPSWPSSPGTARSRRTTPPRSSGRSASPRPRCSSPPRRGQRFAAS